MVAILFGGDELFPLPRYEDSFIIEAIPVRVDAKVSD